MFECIGSVYGGEVGCGGGGRGGGSDGDGGGGDGGGSDGDGGGGDGGGSDGDGGGGGGENGGRDGGKNGGGRDGGGGVCPMTPYIHSYTCCSVTLTLPPYTYSSFTVIPVKECTPIKLLAPAPALRGILIGPPESPGRIPPPSMMAF